MFQWNWDSIARECTNFVGPAGYGYVQVNPPQEHIQGDSWWTDYQAVSYQLTSKHGNRDQFANMVQACHAAGVGVIVDTIWNHMSGVDSGNGYAGSSFTKYNYPGIYQDSDFHACRHGIDQWNNATSIQTCQLAGLADLATEKEHVRSRLAQYGNDLLSLNVDGLRIDAAKHMAVGDISNILSRLNKQGKNLYVTQEVVYGAGQPVTPNQYTQMGHVQEFRFKDALTAAFTGSSRLSDLQNLDNRGWVPSAKANVFVANHDTERDTHDLNYNSPSNTYILANIFALAHPYGTPTVLSSYSFSSGDTGAPNGGTGVCSGNGGSNGWLCQHRWQAISGMVGFRNTVGNVDITNWTAPAAQRIAFGRGSLGFVAINNEDSEWWMKFHTSLPDGSYCDVISGKRSSNGKCNGSTITVSQGSFTATVPARGSIAIHAGAKSS
ncbi:glycoside hydrolase family 13 protein [Dichomitus squalens]|uniref:Alpha-amylase n=2 Tax=Dichomitus squalens TaxID=114155 RepID=A0A4Q9NU83_9APHY|nr:glycoside hydrolase family 13 protein [Dichomitus squalens LYAD-421 SS1]EJF58002.1 glycoside hydrolase family 13 protein [Dichomitus squalens LYAD-421 SS1]TBU44928.1 glycoside hydrolase family 13 protein [Dichomitus squalens]TBU56517.1 glycoside hydrolase family 13 protein [Dichomitus squalens]